ncbi:hypothetical protein BHE74_00038755 [Ensete ventricosum]|nr:hypothetical protein BHE74_00038755 [Ensete ventricosum]RZS14691.1 hypothetical protein BHM03_00046413 [Ensete ventricosum]
MCGWFYGTPEKTESACLGPAHVRKLVFVNQEEVVKFRTGRSDRFGSESWVPPSRDLSKDPTQRPRRDRSVRRDPSNDQNPRSCDHMRTALLFFLAAVLLLPLVVHGDCDCSADEEARDKKAARPLKIVAIFSILVCGSIGVCIPILGKWIPVLDPDRDAFFVIKAFAAGVILATAFVHILPDSFDSLTSSCLHPDPWHNFPFAGFGAMIAAIGTLMIDTLATGYFSRPHKAVSDETKTDVETRSDAVHEETAHVHTHAHAHGHPSPHLIRHRVISQVNNFPALTKGGNESLVFNSSFSHVHCFGAALFEQQQSDVRTSKC